MVKRGIRRRALLDCLLSQSQVKLCHASDPACDDAAQPLRPQRQRLPVDKECCMETLEPDNTEYRAET